MKIHTVENGSNMLTKVLSAEKVNVCWQRIVLMKHPMPEWRGSLLGNMSLRMGMRVQIESGGVSVKPKTEIKNRFMTDSEDYICK